MAIATPPQGASQAQPSFAGAPAVARNQQGYMGGTPPANAVNPAVPANPYGANPNLDLNQILSGLQGGLPPSVTGAPGGSSIASLWPFIQGTQLDPAMTTLGAQTDLANNAGALTQQQLGLQTQQTQAEAGFSQAQIGNQLSGLGISQNALNQQYGPGGTAGQQTALTTAEQNLQTQQAQRGLRSSATAAGSINTQGTQQSWSDILANQGFQRQQSALTTKEQQQQYQTSTAQLNNAAKALGISSQEITSRLTNALQQLGLQGQIDANGVMQTIQQLQSGFISGPLANITQEILSSAGLPIQAFGQTGGPQATAGGQPIVPGTNVNPSTGQGL
jgi:hypothetical protein